MEVYSGLFSATLIVILVINVQKYGFVWSFKSLKRPGL